MFSYEQWSQALVQYFVEDAPPGSAVFLTIEPLVLADAARSLGQTLSADAAAADLCEAVRRRCLRQSGRLDSQALEALTSTSHPGQVGFLAALVLAAYRMQDDDEAGISERCYYARLAEVFGSHHATRLAMGFAFAEQAEDRRAWEGWNRFLVSRGLTPTARAGIGAWTHIRYAESQTLLRMADQEWLEDQLFLREMQRRKLSRYLSKDQLGSWLRQPEVASGQLVRRRIRDLITETDARRRDAFLTQAYAIYTECDPLSSESDRAERRRTGEVRRAASRVDAGLFRRVRLGQPPEYLIYPQSPPGRPLAKGAVVVVDGSEYQLSPDDRSGWCRPLCPAPPFLSKVLLELRQAGPYNTLLFPERSIWTLVRDPLDFDTVDRASWDDPTPGEPFFALARSHKQGSMFALRDAGLIDWMSGPHTAEGLAGWDEYRSCQIVQTVWSGSAAEIKCDEEVYEALRPGKQERVILRGGLRYPGERATWLKGAAPAAFGYASCEPLHLSIRRFDRPSAEFREPINSGGAWPLTSHAADVGSYEVSLIHSPSRGTERVLAETRFNVVGWDDLVASEHVTPGVGDGIPFVSATSADSTLRGDAS